MSSTARALGETLEALADALAQARPDAVAAGVGDIDARVRDFQQAAAEAVAGGASLPADDAARVSEALARCRRLGVSLSLLARPFLPPPDAPHGYDPVGQPLSSPGEGAFLTTRV